MTGPNSAVRNPCLQDLPVEEVEIECWKPSVRQVVSFYIGQGQDGDDYLYIMELAIKAYGAKNWKSES